MYFWTKIKNTTTTKQNLKHKNPCRSRELNAGPHAPEADALPLHQLRVTIVIKLINCFDAMVLNANKQADVADHTFSTNSFIMYMHGQLYLAVLHIYRSCFHY